MKRIFQIQLILLLLLNCNSKVKLDNYYKDSKKIEFIVTKILENNESYFFVNKENDVIESAKINTEKLKCTKIKVDDKYRFYVINMSTQIQDNQFTHHGGSEYYINDTLKISYKNFYISTYLKKYCY